MPCKTSRLALAKIVVHENSVAKMQILFYNLFPREN